MNEGLAKKSCKSPNPRFTTNNKSCAEQEPCSAHGRAVNSKEYSTKLNFETFYKQLEGFKRIFVDKFRKLQT